MPILRIALLLLCFSMVCNAQQTISGWVVDKESNAVVPETHVINKSTLDGTLTDRNGYFELKLQFGDTIVFSNISYKYFYFVYQDSAQSLDSVMIYMEEQDYMLNEVSVFAYELTSNDPKEMPLNKPQQPTNEELPDQKIIDASPGNPAEFLYNMFGSKHEELRKLAKLKKDFAYREKLKETNNRESIMTLTGLNKQELEAFMFYCKYAPVRIRTMNDYQYLKSLQRCYQQYVQDKELENFLQQFD